jgi:hypothetical protein
MRRVESLSEILLRGLKPEMLSLPASDSAF